MSDVEICGEVESIEERERPSVEEQIHQQLEDLNHSVIQRERERAQQEEDETYKKRRITQMKEYYAWYAELFQKYWDAALEEQDFDTLGFEYFVEDGQGAYRTKPDWPNLFCVPPMQYRRTTMPTGRLGVVLGTHLGNVLLFQAGLNDPEPELEGLHGLNLLVSRDIIRCGVREWCRSVIEDRDRIHYVMGRPAEGGPDPAYQSLAASIEQVFNVCKSLDWDKQ